MIFIPKGASNEADKFRPISLLEFIGKILEKIIHNRLYLHLQQNDLLNPKQFGFRAGRGCHMAVALFWESLAHARAKNQKSLVALRDVTKAFDRVWHGALIAKLSAFNPLGRSSGSSQVSSRIGWPA